MFEIPGSDVVKVHITEDVVHGKNSPAYFRKSQTPSTTPDDEDNVSVEVQARAEVK